MIKIVLLSIVFPDSVDFDCDSVNLLIFGALSCHCEYYDDNDDGVTELGILNVNHF